MCKAGNTQGLICPLFIMLKEQEIRILGKTSIQTTQPSTPEHATVVFALK